MEKDHRENSRACSGSLLLCATLLVLESILLVLLVVSDCSLQQTNVVSALEKDTFVSRH